jgi:hypothetical protein
MIEAACAQCGGAFQTRRRRPSKFCSHSCAASYNQPVTEDLQTYRQLYIDGTKVLEHRYVMEKALGRPLATDEVVHHIDGNKRNNDLGNLVIKTRRAHAQEHHQEWKDRREA